MTSPLSSTPRSWPGRPFTFLHSSDWHWGATRQHLHEHARERYRYARLSAISTLIDHARQQQADAIVVAGDILDSPHLSEVYLTHLCDVLQQTPCPIVLVPGNHDPVNSTPFYHRKNQQKTPLPHLPSSVIVADTPGIIALPDLPSVELIAAPMMVKFPSRHPLWEALDTLPAHPPTSPRYRIAVTHMTVDAFAPRMDAQSGTDIIPMDTLRQRCQDYGIDYLALGDRHSCTALDHESPSPRLWYSGSPEVTDFDDRERHSGTALSVTLEGENCTVTPLICGEWSFHTHQASLYTRSDIEDMVTDLSHFPKTTTALRILLNGRLSLKDKTYLDTLIEKISTSYAGYELRPESSLVALPEEFHWEEHVGGPLLHAAQVLLQQAQEGDETAQRALELLYRQTIGRTEGQP